MKWRHVHEFYAKMNGYFWLPCPLCGQYFGGHEWKDYDGKSSSIPHEDPEKHPYGGRGICPDCTKAGKGQDWRLR